MYRTLVLVCLVGLGCTSTKPVYDAQAEQERRDRIRQQIADSAKTDYAIREPVPPRETPKPEPEENKPDLELVDWELDGGGLTVKAVGIVKNNTSRNYRYVQIMFNVYDSSDNRVGTAMANLLTPA